MKRWTDTAYCWKTVSAIANSRAPSLPRAPVVPPRDVSYRRAAAESSRPAVRGAGGVPLFLKTSEGGAGGIESFRAMLKRGQDGVYHHFSKKHLGRYVTEFEGRHNRRPLDTA